MATSGSSPSRRLREYTSGQSQNWCGFSPIDEKKALPFGGRYVGAHHTFIAIHTLATPLHTFMQQPSSRHFSRQSVPHLHFTPMQEPAGLEHAYARTFCDQTTFVILHFLYSISLAEMFMPLLLSLLLYNPYAQLTL